MPGRCSPRPPSSPRSERHDPLRRVRLPVRADAPRRSHVFQRLPAEGVPAAPRGVDRKSTRLNSSHSQISYAVFCLKKKTTSIAAYTVSESGLDPTFLVGGVVQNFGAIFRVTNSDYFIIEGDDYDTAYFDHGPQFMH